MKQLTLADIIGSETNVDYKRIWHLFYNHLLTHDNEVYSAENLRQIMRRIEYKEWNIL